MRPEPLFDTALYGRTSKDDPRTVTIQAQQKILRDWWPQDPLVRSVVDGYWDEGVSGKIPLSERKEGKRLLADVAAGRVNSVAVALVDRWGRTLLDGLQAVKALEDQGVKLVAVRDGWDARRNDSPLYFQFRMMIAEEEHRRIRERMEGGKLRAMDRDNAPPGGALVFGYRMGEDGHFTVDPDESALVIEIFAMYDQGASMVEILAWVETLGVPAGRRVQKRAAGSPVKICAPHAGARWTVSKVSRILTNPVYTGTRTWKGRSFRCPRLIDQVLFDRVQTRAQARGGRYQGSKAWNPAHGLMTGLMKCAQCGGWFYFNQYADPRRRRTGYHRDTYRCQNYNKRAGAGCRAKELPVGPLDDQVWGTIETYLSSPAELLRKVLGADQLLGHQVADLDAAERAALDQAAAIEHEVKDLWAEQQAHDWPMGWVAPRLDALHQRLKETTARLAAVRERRSLVIVDREQATTVTAALATIRGRLRAGLSPADKRHIIELLLAGALVNTTQLRRPKKAEVTIRLKWGEMIDCPQPGTTSPEVAQHWCYANEGNGTLPVVLRVG